jgi:hypothetical protein
MTMPCMTQPDLTPTAKQAQRKALDRLEQALGAGTVRVVVAKSGAIAFDGWAEADRSGVSDLCAYRAISNSPAMRRALLRAEAMSGNRMDPRAIAAGLHSHDGGRTWGAH